MGTHVLRQGAPLIPPMAPTAEEEDRYIAEVLRQSKCFE